MTLKDALVKAILLAIMEKKIHGEVSSTGLLKEVFKIIDSKTKTEPAGDNNVIYRLKALLYRIIDEGIKHIQTVIDNIELITVDTPNLIKIIKSSLDTDVTDDIIKHRHMELKDFVIKHKLIELLEITTKRLKISDVNHERILKDFMTKLEEKVALDIVTEEDDVDVIDFSITDHIDRAVNIAVETYKDSEILKTGWECMNEMLQGGFRRGELAMLAALPHNYKSGMTKSLFLQLARLNKPEAKDGKKPLMLFISFEEELKVIVPFFYSYLKYVKEGVPVNNKNIDLADMKMYLSQYLNDEVNYNIKIMKLDPSATTYKDIKNIVVKLEKDGYDLHALFIDYLSQMSTEGCVQKGPSGTEYKDLFKRMRTIANKHNFLLVTPHQISTEAKRLIKNGIPDIEFVKHLVGKGYYAHSGQLDQEADLEIFLHIARLNKKPVLTVQRGKHRIPTVIDDEKKFLMLEFPKGAPIPEDRISEDGNVESACINPNEIEEDFGF